MSTNVLFVGTDSNYTEGCMRVIMRWHVPNVAAGNLEESSLYLPQVARLKAMLQRASLEALASETGCLNKPSRKLLYQEFIKPEAIFRLYTSGIVLQYLLSYKTL